MENESVLERNRAVYEVSIKTVDGEVLDAVVNCERVRSEICDLDMYLRRAVRHGQVESIKQELREVGYTEESLKGYGEEAFNWVVMGIDVARHQLHEQVQSGGLE